MKRLRYIGTVLVKEFISQFYIFNKYGSYFFSLLFPQRLITNCFVRTVLMVTRPVDYCLFKFVFEFFFCIAGSASTNKCSLNSSWPTTQSTVFFESSASFFLKKKERRKKKKKKKKRKKKRKEEEKKKRKRRKEKKKKKKKKKKEREKKEKLV
jgi:hypothetical protein